MVLKIVKNLSITAVFFACFQMFSVEINFVPLHHWNIFMYWSLIQGSKYHKPMKFS